MPLETTFTILDSYGRVTTKTFASKRTTMADMVSDIAAAITALEGVTMGKVIQTKASEVTPVAGSPETGANIDAGGTLHVRLNDSKLYGLKVPAFETEFVLPTGAIDTTEVDVQSFVALFETAGNWRLAEDKYITSVAYAEIDR